MPRITREHVAVVLGRAIDAGGSLVFLKLLASTADKSAVGSYMLAASYVAIALTLSFSALDQGLLRNVVEYQRQGGLGRRFSALLVTYAALSVPLSMAGLALLGLLDAGRSLLPVGIALSLWLALEAIKNLCMNLSSGLRARLLIALASAVDYSCRIGLLWFTARTESTNTAAILTLLATAAAAAALSYLAGHRALLARFRWHDVVETLNDSIRFSWPMIVWGLFGWLQNMSNRWMLGHFAGLEVVAEYGVLVALATFPVTALLGVVVTYLVPILYEQESQHPGAARRQVARFAWGLVPVCATMVVLAAVWHRDIVVSLTSEAYASHSQLLPWVMAAACASAVASVLTYSIYAQRKVSSLFLANIIPGLSSLGLGYFTVSHFQLVGAIATHILSNLISCALFVGTFHLYIRHEKQTGNR